MMTMQNRLRSKHHLALAYALFALLLTGCLPANVAREPVNSAATAAPTATRAPVVIGAPAATSVPAATESPAAPASSQPAGQYRVLFDASHGETFGNADWVISSSQPDPLAEHARPQRETDWTGALSAWGVALQQTGRYRLMSLPRGQPISYGDRAKPLDLANFNVFVVPEPNIRFTDAEKTAIMSFVQGGGGLFMIADHDKSDRNNDGIDSLHIWNDLMSDNTIKSGDPFGFRFDVLNIGSDNPRGIPASAAKSPVIRGPFGAVTGSIIRDGTTATLIPQNNPAIQGLLYRSRADTSGNTGVFFLTSTFGQGRVAAWGDSSAVDDGTGAANETLFDGWDDAGGSNAILALNATEWLAQGTLVAPAANAPMVAPTAVAASAGQTLVQNGDFERGMDGWSARTSNNRALVSPARAHAGSQSADFCGYNDCAESLTQKISIPAGAKDVRLSYYSYIATQETKHAFDFLTVELRDTGGKRLRLIQRLSDGDNAGSWQQTSVNLSGYAGQTLQLVLSASSGRTKPTEFFIDDVELTAQ